MQEDLNDLVRDLYQSKQQLELLAVATGQDKCKNPQFQDTDFTSFFDMENNLCYLKNIFGLFIFLGFPHNLS